MASPGHNELIVFHWETNGIMIIVSVLYISQELYTWFIICYVLLWLGNNQFYSYPSWLLRCHLGHPMIAPMPLKQPWSIWTPNTLNCSEDYKRCIHILFIRKQNQIHNGATPHVAYSILSIPSQLMPWWLKEPGHQQACYRPNKLECSISSIIMSSVPKKADKLNLSL